MMTSTSRPNGRKMPAGWIWQTSHLQNFSQRRRKRHLRTKANSCRFLLGRERVILHSLYALAAAQAGLKQLWILNIAGGKSGMSEIYWRIVFIFTAYDSMFWTTAKQFFTCLFSKPAPYIRSTLWLALPAYSIVRIFPRGHIENTLLDTCARH